MKMKLWIIIGIPGSGKSTKANEIAVNFEKNNKTPLKIYEADMFFINKQGKYRFDPNKIGAAHVWCKAQVEAELSLGNSVIVSNTSLTKKERKVYIDLAKKYKADVEVITCIGNYQNIHNVPPEKIEKMKQKFVPFSLDELN